jgi:hypothetical protein
VSLPWRDPLSVWLAPTEVTLVRRNFGFRGFGEQMRVLRPQPVLQGPAWRGAVDALAQSLEGSSARTARARVVLSNHFVRYVVARWREDLQSPAERQALIHHTFRETYGAAADSWTLREDTERYGRASLACAIDAALLDALRDVFRRAHMRVASVQPLFMSAFNRHRREMGDSGGFFVYEKGRLCSACFEHQEWRSVSNARVERPQALAAAIDRELVLHGLADDAPAYLCIVDDTDPPTGLARPVKVLERRQFEGADLAVAVAEGAE